MALVAVLLSYAALLLPALLSGAPLELVAVAPLGLLAGLALGWHAVRRLGGVTGDVLGACVELSELTVLLTVTAWTSARL
jgi:adenosylcobinamide-GDP ribazoletransferase